MAKRKKRLFRQLFFYQMVVSLTALVILGWYAVSSMRMSYLEESASRLEVAASFLRDRISEMDLLADDELVHRSEELGRLLRVRLTVVDRSGRVLADSEGDRARMDNHGDRPEIMEAYAGRTGTSRRYSYTLGLQMIYLALPIERGGEVVGVVRAALPLPALQTTIWQMQREIIVAAILIGVAAVLLSLWLSRRISQPLESIRRGAEEFAEGKLDRKLPVPEIEEIGGLAETLNRMAGQLNDRIATTIEQRNEQESMLASMVEGVVAVDHRQRLLRMNRAAIRLFHVEIQPVEGKLIQEVIRHTEFDEFVGSVLSGNSPREGEISVINETERILQLNGTILQNASGNKMGAVIVLNDISRLKRLERMRKEFVANVSHELKTPITTIQSAVEALSEHGLSLSEEAGRFLKIIQRHSERMNSIIDDLLALSSIEARYERREIPFEDTGIWPILEAAIQDYAQLSAERNIKLELYCDRKLVGHVNAAFVQQAVGNLIDNAIKYSLPGGRVEVRAEAHPGMVISVRDWGQGIPRDKQERLFERFYRVDKARSRKRGGTGLGLAIVKHIALAHNARVEVESQLGEGSTFSIYFPHIDQIE